MTDKQKKYIYYLLEKKGYDTKLMNAQYKNLGAKMQERSGKVEDWLNSRSQSEINKIIEALK